MNKKNILILLITVFIIMLIPMVVFAKKVDTDYFSIDLPDDFETSGPYTDNSSYSVIYDRNNDKGYASIHLKSYSKTKADDEMFTQQYIDERVESIKENYKNEYFDVESVSGKTIELDGVKAYVLMECFKAKSETDGRIIKNEHYYLKTDKTKYTIDIHIQNDGLSSSECTKILNSFKVKDTVIGHFTDLKENEWYYKAVDYVYRNNIIKGYNATTFAPNDKLTRGQLVTILHRMEGSPKVTGTSKFSDVQDSKQYYYNAVIWATNNKIVSGYDNGKFGAEDNITREQLAVILWKYAKYKGKDVSASNNLSAFTDTNKISSWALTQVKWAVGAGVISGNANKTLNPAGNATRAEVAAMMEKYCKKVGR